MDMIKRVLKKKEGFTLVELIVVLVILAILAAILVPTLTGYINQANTEKDYATAQTVRVAAQSVATDKYGRSKDGTAPENITLTDKTAAGQTVQQLAGVGSDVSACNFTVTKDTTTGNVAVTSGTVTINGHTYTYNANKDGRWTAQ